MEKMKQSMLMLIVLTFIIGSENNKSQYRHDTNHHKNIQQKPSE
jgi:hypothetical protein